MKTITRNISLPVELDEFARKEVAGGVYSSLSEYFRELLRQRRQQQIDADLELLDKASRAASSESEPVEEIVTTSRRVRQQMRREKWTPGE